MIDTLHAPSVQNIKRVNFGVGAKIKISKAMNIVNKSLCLKISEENKEIEEVQLIFTNLPNLRRLITILEKIEVDYEKFIVDNR